MPVQDPSYRLWLFEFKLVTRNNDRVSSISMRFMVKATEESKLFGWVGRDEGGYKSALAAMVAIAPGASISAREWRSDIIDR